MSQACVPASYVLTGEDGSTFELIEAAYPRHMQSFNKYLNTKLMRTWHLSLDDITLIRNHFGEEVMMLPMTRGGKCERASERRALGSEARRPERTSDDDLQTQKKNQQRI